MLLELSTVDTRSFTTKRHYRQGKEQLFSTDKSYPRLKQEEDNCSPYYHKEDEELI